MKGKHALMLPYVSLVSLLHIFYYLLSLCLVKNLLNQSKFS